MFKWKVKKGKSDFKILHASLHMPGCWVRGKATFNSKIWSQNKISHQSRWEAKLGVDENDDGDDFERKTPHVVQVPHELPEKKWSSIQRLLDHLMLRVSSAARLSTPPRSMLFSWASSGLTWIVPSSYHSLLKSTLENVSHQNDKLAFLTVLVDSFASSVSSRVLPSSPKDPGIVL